MRLFLMINVFLKGPPLWESFRAIFLRFISDFILNYTQQRRRGTFYERAMTSSQETRLFKSK